MSLPVPSPSSQHRSLNRVKASCDLSKLQFAELFESIQKIKPAWKNLIQALQKLIPQGHERTLHKTYLVLSTKIKRYPSHSPKDCLITHCYHLHRSVIAIRSLLNRLPCNSEVVQAMDRTWDLTICCAEIMASIPESSS